MFVCVCVYGCVCVYLCVDAGVCVRCVDVCGSERLCVYVCVLVIQCKCMHVWFMCVRQILIVRKFLIKYTGYNVTSQ